MVARTPVQEPGEQAAVPAIEMPEGLVDIPEVPAIEVPAIGPLPAFSLPIPVTVINWPAALRPVQAAPPAADERVEPVEEEEDIDKEFEKESEPEPAPTLPKSQLPVAPKAGDSGGGCRRTRDPGDRNPDDPGTVGISPGTRYSAPRLGDELGSDGRPERCTGAQNPELSRLPAVNVPAFDLPIPVTCDELGSGSPGAMYRSPKPRTLRPPGSQCAAFDLPIPVTVINWPIL